MQLNIIDTSYQFDEYSKNVDKNYVPIFWTRFLQLTLYVCDSCGFSQRVLWLRPWCAYNAFCLVTEKVQI